MDPFLESSQYSQAYDFDTQGESQQITFIDDDPFDGRAPGQTQDDDAAHELKEVTKATGKSIKILTGSGTLNRVS